MRISDWSSDVCSSDLKECAQLKSRDSVCHKGILLFNQFIPWLGSLDTRLVPFDVTIRIRFKDRWQNRVVGGQIHILGGGFRQPILYERLDTTSRNILFARNQGEDHGIDLVGIEIQRPKVEYISIADYV